MRMPISRLAFTFLLVALTSPPAIASTPVQADDVVARDGEPTVAEKVGKVLHAHRLGGERIRLDGRLDEGAWARADSIADFVQWEPDNMAPMTERTVLRVLYDERYLYVGVRLYESEPDRITTGLGRRDDLPSSDAFFVGFDPRHDHLTGFIFGTNPSGVQEDAFAFDDDRFDSEYDAVWEVRVGIAEDGWAAEFRIPFSQMRFSAPADGPVVWGFDARREIFRKGEEGQWVGRPRGARGQVSRWGHLIFEDGLSSPRRIELLPFTVARRTDLPATSADYGGDAGLDLRLGLGTSATLSATVNPDFGQVELDPAVLNLSVFETFFPEKRPFFLEDSRTFVPPYFLFQLFHSRRIGQRPGRFPLGPSDRLVDRPDQTTILGATKVTGKGSGWTYGALTALTAREYATVDSVDVDPNGVETVTRRDRLIEPLTSYNAVRFQRDILGGSSNVGALATAVLRDGDANAFAGGVDWKIRWDENRFEWNGHWAATRAPGPGGMRTGLGGITNFFRSGKHFGFNVHIDHFGPDFRVTDLGFLRTRQDATSVNAGINAGQPDPWRIFRRISVFAGGGRAWNKDGLVLDHGFGTGFNAQFLNFWSVFGNVFHNFEALDDLDTRGGPPIVRPASTGYFLGVNSDSRKTWRFSWNFSGRRDAAGGWSARVGPRLNLQPSPRLQASLGSGYRFGRDAAQWIANLDADGDGELDHVYGTLRRDVIDVTLRSTYAIHRDLTLQLFLQPFVAVGDYSEIRKLSRPRSFEFEPVEISFDPDFNVKSLRGNLVLRWEYVRGSTLFVAYSLSAFDDARPGVFQPLRDLGDAFDADGTHVFLIKASYWLSL